MSVFWLEENPEIFPHPSLSNSDGLLAIGGDLSPRRLLNAYRIGIFPWYNEHDPILWWSPNPRFCLFPNELKVSKSMRPYFNQSKFRVSFDTQFSEVMRNCKSTYREGQVGSWINQDMIDAYTQLHEMGHAHSVEVWKDKKLVGGLYGIAIGNCFFGESMFALESNASKYGFITLVKMLEKNGFTLIDCQQETRHLKSLGAKAIDRPVFLELLDDAAAFAREPHKWTSWMDGIDNVLK